MTFERWAIVFLVVVIGVILYVLVPRQGDQNINHENDSLQIVNSILLQKAHMDSVLILIATGEIASRDSMLKIKFEGYENIKVKFDSLRRSIRMLSPSEQIELLGKNLGK